MPEDFREIASASSEDVEVAGVRVPLQLLLNLKRQALHAASHIRMAGRDPDPATSWQWNHERSAFKVAAITEDGAVALIFTRTSFQLDLDDAGRGVLRRVFL